MAKLNEEPVSLAFGEAIHRAIEERIAKGLPMPLVFDYETLELQPGVLSRPVLRAAAFGLSEDLDALDRNAESAKLEGHGR